MPRTLADFSASLGAGEEELRKWQAHLVFFARKGFTSEGQSILKISDVLSVDLKRINSQLGQLSNAPRRGKRDLIVRTRNDLY